MARVYVSIGSNIDRDAMIRAGIADLKLHYGDLVISTVYESEAVGFEGDSFYNLVVGFDTTEDVRQVAAMLREIEDNHGRTRSGPRFSARTLDLDLLLYDDAVLQQEGLDIPRDEITKNAFVLRPLAEIAPDVMHPVLHQTFADLWHSYEKAKQRLWPVAFDF